MISVFTAIIVKVCLIPRPHVVLIQFVSDKNLTGMGIFWAACKENAYRDSFHPCMDKKTFDKADLWEIVRARSDHEFVIENEKKPEFSSTRASF